MGLRALLPETQARLPDHLRAIPVLVQQQLSTTALTKCGALISVAGFVGIVHILVIARPEADTFSSFRAVDHT